MNHHPSFLLFLRPKKSASCHSLASSRASRDEDPCLNTAATESILPLIPENLGSGGGSGGSGAGANGAGAGGGSGSNGSSSQGKGSQGTQVIYSMRILLLYVDSLTNFGPR